MQLWTLKTFHSPQITSRSSSLLLFISVCFPSENAPPALDSMPFRLHSFQGENFFYQLQARDPEGSALLFTLKSGPEAASLSPDGLLTWKATAETTDTHTFQFTVTDDCRAETRGSIQVILLNPGLMFCCVFFYVFNKVWMIAQAEQQ